MVLTKTEKNKVLHFRLERYLLKIQETAKGSGNTAASRTMDVSGSSQPSGPGTRRFPNSTGSSVNPGEPCPSPAPVTSRDRNLGGQTAPTMDAKLQTLPAMGGGGELRVGATETSGQNLL